MLSPGARKTLLTTAAVLAGSALITLAYAGPLRAFLPGLVNWLRSHGPLGYLAYAGVYVIAALFAAPQALLTGIAGFTFGPVTGVLVASPASALGASAAFAAGRTLLRDALARRVAGNARFAAVDEAVHQEGLKIVFLLRLSPLVPHNLLNFALGLTRAKPRDYVLGTWAGMLPLVCVQVYIGSVVRDVADLVSGGRGLPVQSAWQWVGLAAGLLATLAALWLIMRSAKKALSRSLAVAQTSGTTTPAEPRADGA